MSDVDDFIAAGLYDPAAVDAAARLELLRYLTDEIGASIPEILQAHEDGGILSMAAFRTLRSRTERLTLNEVAQQAGMRPDLARLFWRCVGFADPRPFERRFDQRDVETLQLFRMLSELVGEQRSLSLARTFGESVARLADAEVALLRSNVEAPLAASQQYAAVARAYVNIVSELVPRIATTFDALHAHHIQAIGRRYSEVGAPTSALNVVELAVAFADLSGFTGLSMQLEPAHLGDMIDRFEAVTGDTITAVGATVAKRIGDAVMYVSNAPGVACALALDLIEGCMRCRTAEAAGRRRVRRGHRAPRRFLRRNGEPRGPVGQRGRRGHRTRGRVTARPPAPSPRPLRLPPGRPPVVARLRRTRRRLPTPPPVNGTPSPPSHWHLTRRKRRVRYQ